ncbi:MAG TPA: DDE-type integrase/transposase/recombinase [Clostridia bacterium]|nr:DDE-type integrase/transposase/recombinase [Clostridia bacterium]
MNDKNMIEIGYFRFALIAPVIQGVFPDATKTAYYRRVTQNPLKHPDGQEILYNFKTLEKWEACYRKGGMDGLIPKSRSDKGLSRTLNDAAVEEIYRLKSEYPRLNATMVYHRLIEDGFIKKLEVSLASVQRFIKKNDLKSARLITMKDRKAFEEEFAGSMYQADTCYGPFITEDGQARRTYLIMIIDDASRLIVGGRYFYNDNAYNFQIVLKEAIARYGIPNKLYLDNGSTYRNEQLSLICGSIGTVELHTKIRDGASKGKVERNFRTLKDRWLNGLNTKQIFSLEAFNRELMEYIKQHNTTVHSAIGEKPIDRYMRDMDRIRKPKTRGELDQCFMNRHTRRVNNDSTLSLFKTSFDAPMQFIGMKVQVRYLPDNLDKAYIYYEGESYPLRLTDKVANSKTKRNNAPIDYSKTGGNIDV